jgi:hypothetical protein
VRSALERADELQRGRLRDGKQATDQLAELAAQLDAAGTGGSARDGSRARALAGTLREISARLR